MKELEVKTKRLTLRPMSDSEIEALMERINDEELRTAYGEMLDGCKRDPENRIWYAPWKMILKDTQESVGDLCFKGPVKNHAVEVGYGVQPEQEGRGYTTEALRAMTQWAFSQKDVVFVEAETAPDNKASQRVLEKCGFVPDGTTGEEGPRFVLERPLTNWSPIYMLFGMSIGMAIGRFQDQMIFGMAIGMSLGVLFSVPFNNSEKKKREALRQQRHPYVLAVGVRFPLLWVGTPFKEKIMQLFYILCFIAAFSLFLWQSVFAHLAKRHFWQSPQIAPD